MSLRHVFVAGATGFSLSLLIFLPSSSSTKIETEQAGEDLKIFVRATGKCAACHPRKEYSVVHLSYASRSIFVTESFIGIPPPCFRLESPFNVRVAIPSLIPLEFRRICYVRFSLYGAEYGAECRRRSIGIRISVC
jgi:hypothetical protein